MKRVTASEARRNWFRLLDEVAGGAVVMIERGGRRIVLRREDPDPAGAQVPDYSGILKVAEPERADEWRWGWPGEEGDVTLEPREGDDGSGNGPAADPDRQAPRPGPGRGRKGGPGGRGPW
jgi:hypothetical protein